MTNNFVAYWKQQQAKRQRKNRELSRAARRDVEQITRFLADSYGATQVILFGSLVKGRFATDSGIDLAVAGLPPDEFFTIYAEVNRLTRFRVDLKPLESLHPHFRRRVLTQGEIIYEAVNSPRT
jgi:predicted nucleotidyltransferase